MRSSAMRLSLLALASSLALGLVLPGEVAAQKKVRWKMASAFTSSLDVVGESGPIFSENLRKMSGGALEVKFYEPGALVPAFEYSTRSPRGPSRRGYHARLPRGPDSVLTLVHHGAFALAGEYLAWLKYGGGQELKDEIYARHGVRGINCITITPEASGWFKKEIKTVDDLQGLKMRFFGLGARVMQKLGVQTQLIPPGDIFPALERGIIDATELAFLHRPQAGLPPDCQALLLPGLASAVLGGRAPGQPREVEGAFRGASQMIEVACDANLMWTYVTSEARQFGAMREMVDKHGVQIHFWPEGSWPRCAPRGKR